MKTVILFLFMAFMVTLSGQVAINSDGSNPDPSAILDLQSNVKGFLVPRLTSQEKENISQPATGLLIYQIDGITGFYYNQGTALSPIWTMLGSPGTNSLWIRSGSNATSLAFPNDSVGIGRFQPVEKLNVNGNVSLDNFQPLILFREDTLEGARIQHMGSQIDGYLHLQAWDGNQFETTGLVVRSMAQNVGIGTIQPAFKLDVAGSAHMTGFILSSSTQDGYVLTSDDNGTGSWRPAASHMVSSGTINYLSKFASADSLVNSVVYQDSSSNIGIGTKVPIGKLDVAGKLNMRDNIGMNGNWLSGDGNNEGIYVSGDGKVGIGTSSPASLLTSSGMIQTLAGGVKFPDNTIQTTAASTPKSYEPRDAAEPRLLVALMIPGFQGPLDLDECNDCSKILYMKWYMNQSFDSVTGMVNNSSPQHHKLTLYKNLDGMSVPMIAAMVNRQLLQHVFLKFYMEGSHQEPEEVYYVISLENAYIVDFHHDVCYVGSSMFAHMDRISFAYQHISWNYSQTPPNNFQTDWNPYPGNK